ncbi:DUF116 domain-containing protein [Lutibacter sp. B2]|nr:DUF116 domain-containing protein [Lutibacter sp. B2]
MNRRITDKNNFLFIRMIFLVLFVSLFMAGLSIYLIKSSNIVLYNAILNIILIGSVLSTILVFMNGILIVRLLKGKKINSLSRIWMDFFLRYIYIIIIYSSQILRVDKNRIRYVFSQLNNNLILSSGLKVKPEEILVLLPHCLQKTTCPHKITVDINNCKRCGLCDINGLVELKDQYNVRLFVATGGTLARKIINEIRPKAIIAVACERDLSSGILDVKKIPVMGILNERPEGPCINTRVSLDKIEETIKFFIEKGKQ